VRDVEPNDVQLVLDRLWPCDCWFCRLFAKRILSRFVRRAIVYEAELREPKALGGEVRVSQEIDVVKELKELKATTSELKSALAEIKAMLADLTGPYSYYKPKEEAERAQRAQLVPVAPAPVAAPAATPSAVATAAEERAEAPPAEARARAPRALEEVARSSTRELEELASVLGEASKVVKEERSVLAGVGLKQAISLLRTAYELLKIYPRSSVERMLELAERLRVLSKEEAEVLRTTINIAEQSLKEDITPEESTMLMYMLLKGIGLKEESIEEEVVRTVLSTLSSMRRAKRPGRAAEGAGGASAGEQG
jgi:hypothetical protein